MPTPRGRVLRSPLLLRLLMEKEQENCNTLGPAIGRSRQLIAHLAYGRRLTCNAETAQLLASRFNVQIDDLFWPESLMIHQKGQTR